ncbi:MAG: Hpt domain-containing protein, partial [Blastocatellia bacterium]
TELAELIETFIGDTERNLEEMESAIDKTDLKAVQRIAHRTDGSCANMGAKYLAELADQLQHAVVSSPGQSRTIIESMRNEFLMVKKSLASEKDRLATEVG